MRIIVGHSNMDLDSLGSIVLARYLYPDHVAVRSGRVHPATRRLLGLYEDKLGLALPSDLKGKKLDAMVVVDTRSADRVEEYLRMADASGAEIEVWDHHPASDRDLPGARVHDRPYGANTTQLGAEIMARGLEVSAEHATIALSGIYADTGNFTHDNVAREDFEVSAWLLAQGADLRLVKDFIVPLRDRGQVILFHEFLGRLESRTVNGHLVQTAYLELEEDCQGLGAVVERAFEIENGEILFGLFWIRPQGRMLIIGRSCAPDVRLDAVLADFGGGGHAQAASATVRTQDGPGLASRLHAWLGEVLAPAATAADIMSSPVATLRPEMALVDASKYLEEVSHTGAPVVGPEGQVLGILTLRDIMRGRKAAQMHVPVATFMSAKPILAAPQTTVREVDGIFFEANIGHLPIMAEGRLVGIVTRTDLLDYKKNDLVRRDSRLKALGVGGRAGEGSWNLASEASD